LVAADAATADATADDATAAGPEAPAGESAAEQAGDTGDAAPDAAKAGAPDVA
jgi:hypothetical protein